MKTAIFIPPLPRISGGISVLLQLSGVLSRLGQDVCFVQREEMGLEWIVPNVSVRFLEDMRFGPEHLWLVPEGWPNALAPALAGGARCVVYVQNWAFMLGVLPEGVRWEQLPVTFLSVSDPVRWFVEEQTGENSPILRPAIDRHRFYPAVPCADGTYDDERPLPEGTSVRIAWMPRKNKVMAQQIRSVAEARLARMHTGVTLEWVEIHGRSQDEVADLLRSAHIFLATGFPEGCPLPPLEAMASGCIVVGFSGLGGWDYMRQARPDLPFAFKPWWPLRQTAWGGNGFYAADADVPGAAMALENAAVLLCRGGPELAALRRAIAATVNAYSVEAQIDAVARIWPVLASQL